jgi:hypothetical protein
MVVLLWDVIASLLYGEVYCTFERRVRMAVGGDGMGWMDGYNTTNDGGGGAADVSNFF